ncbi:Rho guanine nucleotide exchange factor [Marasmius tenuissimus]|nr:Rho guanine nucleotide exchange factor [Marasmius tenuissimus]
MPTTESFDAGVDRLGDISDKQRRNEILEATGDDAQEWLDLMQQLVEYPEVPKALRSSMFKAMIRLSKKTGFHPKCLVIHNVEMTGRHPVGGGAFGDVWEGKMGEGAVCIKVLRVFSTSDIEQVLKDYMQEAIIWRQLDHPNLLPFMGIYYLEDDQKRLCLVSPWMERGNLVQFMKDSPELVDHGSLAWDVACGLSHLHDMKIIHGDLKGANILITPDLRARISDFGLSRISDTQRLFSLQTYHSSGTTRWLAPELLRASENCVSSKESDVYAYGCVCYEVGTS